MNTRTIGILLFCGSLLSIATFYRPGNVFQTADYQDSPPSCLKVEEDYALHAFGNSPVPAYLLAQRAACKEGAKKAAEAAAVARANRRPPTLEERRYNPRIMFGWD